VKESNTRFLLLAIAGGPTIGTRTLRRTWGFGEMHVRHAQWRLSERNLQLEAGGYRTAATALRN